MSRTSTQRLTAFYALLLIVWMFVASVNAAPSRAPNTPRPGDTGRSNTNPQTQSQPSQSPSPAAPRSLPSPNLQKKPPEDGGRLQDKWKEPLVVINIVLIAILALQTWLLKRSVVSAEKSSRAAQDSADATRDYVKITTEIAEMQLRAYVHVGEAVLIVDPEGTPVANVALKNSGQTPAYDLQQWIGIRVEKYPLNIVLPQPPPGFQMAIGTLAAGGFANLSVRTKRPLTPDERSLLGGPEKTIYVYGEIRYKDVFGIERLTKYRLLYGGPGRIREDGGMQHDIEGHEVT